LGVAIQKGKGKREKGKGRREKEKGVNSAHPQPAKRRK
jgi:hypothetical protein